VAISLTFRYEVFIGKQRHCTDRFGALELLFPILKTTSHRTRYIYITTWYLGVFFFHLDKEIVHSIFGNGLVHGTYVSLREGEFSGNTLYYKELIGEWQLALVSVTNCSLGTHNILRIALVHWSYTFLY